MKRKELAMMTGILFASGVWAQTQTGAQAGAQAASRAGQTEAQGSSSATASASPSAQKGQANASLAAGSTINAELASPIDSKKAKPGDPVKGRTTEAAKSADKTVIPKGAKLVGHVTQATARAKGDSDSSLGIVFDKAILKDGQEVPLNVAVQALASAQSASAINGGDEMPAMGGAGASMAGSGRAAGSEALGGVTSRAGAAAGTVTNTAANTGSTAGGALDSTVHSTTSTAAGERGAVAGLNAAGQLSSDSRGVFGLHGIGLTSATTGTAMAAIITSTGKNVHLDSGTRLLLVTKATNAAPRP
jgi:hypothetical protein